MNNNTDIYLKDSLLIFQTRALGTINKNLKTPSTFVTKKKSPGKTNNNAKQNEKRVKKTAT